MTNLKKYIYSNKVWLNNELQPATLCIENDKIISVSNHKHEAAKDYSDCIIMPGVIDPHVHINEPGRTNWEGFETATRAAARGGITTLIDMPLNSSPVVTNLEAFEKKKTACAEKLYVNCGFWAGGIGKNTEEVGELIDAGCLGVKVFLSDSGIEEFPKTSPEDLELLAAALSGTDIPILAHCEFDTLPPVETIHELSLQEQRRYGNYLSSRPRLWENEAVRFLIKTGKKYNCRVHVVHLASEEVLDFIKKEKESGAAFTVETCAHYLFFNGDEIEDGNTLLKCAPPIRNLTTQQALKKALKTGLLDFITSDHSPAPANLKALDTGDFSKAWGGISGLQFLLSASWTAMKSEMSVEEFIPLLTEKPAIFLKLDHYLGKIAPGYQADLSIWKPESSFSVKKEIIEHRHKETPYLNQTLYGENVATYVNGSLVFENGDFSETKKGKMILRNKN